MAELARLQNDPNYVFEFALGPPSATLVDQTGAPPELNLNIQNRVSSEVTRYVMKSAHLSLDDLRMFDVSTGKLAMVSHHPGKNPYDSLDPLSLGNGDANYQRRTMGEWDSVCDVRGYGGFRSFKIRPKKLSRHGRQYVRWDNSEEPLFNMSNVSRLKSQSIRHSTAACREDSRDPVWTITSDMMERTQVVLNEKEEQVAFVQKSLKTLILNAQFGKGSEVVIDIAPGVDQTAVLAVLFAQKQVGAHVVKDAASNFVFEPLQNEATDQAVEALGMGEAVNAYNSLSGNAAHYARVGQWVHKSFFS